MNKNVKIVLGVTLAVGLMIGGFVLISKKKDVAEGDGEGQDSTGNTGSSLPKKKSTTSESGKNAFAKFDGTKVFADKDLKVIYKTAKKGEFIGEIISEEIIGDTPAYKVGGNRYVIKNWTDIK